MTLLMVGGQSASSACDIICDCEQHVTMTTGTDGGSNTAAPKLVSDGSSAFLKTEYQGHVNTCNNEYNTNNQNY